MAPQGGESGQKMSSCTGWFVNENDTSQRGGRKQAKMRRLPRYATEMLIEHEGALNQVESASSPVSCGMGLASTELNNPRTKRLIK